MVFNRIERCSSESKFSVVDEIYFQPNDLTATRIFNNSSYNKDLKTLFLDLDLSTQSIKPKINNFKASLYIFIATCLLSITNLLGKIIGFYFPEVDSSAVNFVRGVVIILLCHIYVYHKNMNMKDEIFKNKNTKELAALFIGSFFGSTSNVLFLACLKYMRINCATTLYSLAPIFTSIFAFIFLKEIFTFSDICSFLICFFSLCLITNPSAFLGFNYNNSDDGDSLYGIFLCLLGAVFNAMGLLLLKYISQKFHFISNLYIMGYIYVFETLIFIIFLSEVGFSTFTFTPMILSILLSVIFFSNISFIFVAMSIGEPIKILPILYTGIILSLIYNFLIFKQPCGFSDIIASFLIIMVNCYRTINQKK